MKYFSYQEEGLGEVWELFSDLASLSKNEEVSNNNCEYEHVFDIVKTAISRKKENNPFGSEFFNLKAYEIKCRSNEKIKQDKSYKDELFIVDKTGEDQLAGYGEITVNDLRLKSIEDDFELFENNEEFESCLCLLYNIRKKYIVTKGVDLVDMLINSLKGIPEAISLMGDLVLKDSLLKEIIEGLCLNSRDNHLLLRLESSI